MYAVQFHPESVMTQDGYRFAGRWLKIVQADSAVARSMGGFAAEGCGRIRAESLRCAADIRFGAEHVSVVDTLRSEGTNAKETT